MKAIGAYTLSNNSGIEVYSVNTVDDIVLASYIYFDNKDDPVECPMMYDEDDRYGFDYKGIFVPFEEVMRI